MNGAAATGAPTARPVFADVQATGRTLRLEPGVGRHVEGLAVAGVRSRRMPRPGGIALWLRAIHSAPFAGKMAGGFHAPRGARRTARAVHGAGRGRPARQAGAVRTQRRRIDRVAVCRDASGGRRRHRRCRAAYVRRRRHRREHRAGAPGVSGHGPAQPPGPLPRGRGFGVLGLERHLADPRFPPLEHR
ncbi:hypothetical protein G6F64_014116 [Rhizopus arrhizus]|uniref:Uncharacterized protein n=1 Tax=Rhizopus oryzae TaxID=64495 RepID=A0A9P7BJT6_RHIOR|nr:hypothetical protein G6F64_014116 [Rhizopus arrhizus]